MINRKVKVLGIDMEEQKKRPVLCKLCSFYNDCEMVGEYTQFMNSHLQGMDQSSEDGISYSYSKVGNGCIMDYKHVKQIECGSKNVTDGIRNHFKIKIEYGDIEKGTKKRWEPRQPVFISAQTGQGKNYFIENALIPYVKKINYRNETDYKVLILSNRLALKQQTKYHLEGEADSSDEDSIIYSYKDVADVMTYQTLLLKEIYLEKKQKRQDRYIYVICDEAHFFTSDAMFNPHTGRILSTIVNLFQNAIRVYMSATPYECLKHIIHYEKHPGECPEKHP